MINYKKHILPGLEAGKTITEIVEDLKPRTAKNIDVLDVRAFLRERMLWMKDPITRARDKGKIGQAMIKEDFPEQLYMALIALEASLYDQSAVQLTTSTDFTIASQVSQTIDGLTMMGIISQEDAQEFYKLGDGCPFKTLTVEEVETVKADYEKNEIRKVELNNIYQLFKNKIQAVQMAIQDDENINLSDVQLTNKLNKAFDESTDNV